MLPSPFLRLKEEDAEVKVEDVEVEVKDVEVKNLKETKRHLLVLTRCIYPRT